MKTLRLGVIVFLCKAFLCGFAEESPCTPGLESELLVFKVHRDHLYKGKTLGRVNLNTCDGKTTTLFQSVDKRFDVNMDGTVTLKRPLTLHEAYEVFSVHAWDANGKKHTVSIRVEFVQHLNGHHKDTVMNISSPQIESPLDHPPSAFSRSLAGLKRAKRGWVIPPFHVPENSRGPFPMKLVQIRSAFAKETEMVYSITGEGADQDPKGIFTVERLSGNLFVTQPLDREKKASYRIIAHSTGREASIAESPMEILINVIDQNDNKPVFTQYPFNGHVHEATGKDYEFMTVTATDADDPETYNGIVNYAIVSQEPPFPKSNMFDINILSGTIRVREPDMDREQWPRYTLLIVAADMEGKGSSTTGTAVITITDSNDNPPQFEQTSLSVSVPENKVGAVVAKLTVSDGDEVGSPAWSTKYRIISGDKGGFFNVSTGPSQLEGIITTVKPLDFEKTKQYVLSVIVENDDPCINYFPTSTATVTVNVEYVKEPPKYTVSVTEKEVGTAVKMHVTDEDDAGSPAWTPRVTSNTFCLR
ncbi:cadherin-4-like isoform X1 [Sinocyclocheilus anshuiensis]|uniref:cadherin-4-like isoform X1 n=1 Tax=Sinocyclocheilus anshuiensis TaxID=1608454 RepID=UPI0007BA583A|nr:PREDICTED: cadherin-4-like isoform X1 [Sinocyclocheilus anshuiensis]